jgi:hypothetical protein
LNYFQSKTVLIISPQPWKHLFVSKHHYAIELAANGNLVYFLEPPCPLLKKGQVLITPTNDYENIHLVQHNPFFPRNIRFHLRWLYKLSVRLQVKLITRAIGSPLNVTWCFDFNLYPDLKIFGSEKNIFHPVDPIPSKYQLEPAKNADLVLSVSHKILSRLQRNSKKGKYHVINHGVSSEFLNVSNAKSDNHNGQINLGFAGNLNRSIIDVESFVQLIQAFPKYEFHFWGPYNHTSELVTAVKAFPNVHLHGSVTKSILAQSYANMDILLMLYRYDENESDLSNSHKVTEYLSSGKVIISSPCSEYVSYPELILTREFPNDYINLVRSVAEDIIQHNSASKREKRIRLAAKNSYTNHLITIDSLISQQNHRTIENRFYCT